MNKKDIILIIIVFIISISMLIYLYFKGDNNYNKAVVYHNNNIIETIDLSINDKYIVNGDNGEVVIEVLDNKIRVINENSPLHLCSKQGFINKSYESIVCLPNKIVIKLINDNETVDGVVK